MKKKSVVLCLALLAVVALTLFLSPSIVPKNSIVKMIEKDSVIFEKTSSAFVVLRGAEKSKVYSVGLNFNLEDYFYAKKRKEKFLKNNFSFSVMFPDAQICASDTALLFSQIRAHAYICMQKASNLIEEDYYYDVTSYPEVFENLLNQDRGELLKDLYFADVKISKIIYEKKIDLDDMTTLLLSNAMFLMESALYQDLDLDKNECGSPTNFLTESYKKITNTNLKN